MSEGEVVGGDVCWCGEEVLLQNATVTRPWCLLLLLTCTVLAPDGQRKAEVALVYMSDQFYRRLGTAALAMTSHGCNGGRLESLEVGYSMKKSLTNRKKNHLQRFLGNCYFYHFCLSLVSWLLFSFNYFSSTDKTCFVLS